MRAPATSPAAANRSPFYFSASIPPRNALPDCPKMAPIFGYGSLLSAASTALTCATAQNRRIGVLNGYVRAFSLVSLSIIKANPAYLDTLEVASLAIRPGTGFVVGVLFDIDDSELEAYKRREARYAVQEVDVVDANGAVVRAWTAIETSDAEYFTRAFGDDTASRHSEVTQYYDGSLWHRRDILPARGYVHVCINGALSLGADVLINLLASLLADGTTTLHDYILYNPLYRLRTTLKGDPLPSTSPMLGPAVDVLASPLVVILGPTACRESIDTAWTEYHALDRSGACASSDSSPPNYLHVDCVADWSPDRLQAVTEFAAQSASCVGLIVLTSALQRRMCEALCARYCTPASSRAPDCVSSACCSGHCDCADVLCLKPLATEDSTYTAPLGPPPVRVCVCTSSSGDTPCCAGTCDCCGGVSDGAAVKSQRVVVDGAVPCCGAVFALTKHRDGVCIVCAPTAALKSEMSKCCSGNDECGAAPTADTDSDDPAAVKDAVMQGLRLVLGTRPPGCG